MHKRRLVAFAAIAVAAAMFAAACRSEKAVVSQASPLPVPAGTSATPGGVSAGGVREVDWGSAAVLDEVRRHFNGGEVEPKRVAYADLTGDGVEEALVVVESGGTAGDLGAAVYRAAAGRVAVLAWIDRAGHIELRLPNVGPNSAFIAVEQGIYAPGDANCCPSRIRETALRWDGSAFVILSEQILPGRP
ncbi:MAG: hypothetical protein EPO16_08640 [Dehalococcoidia bacterium]|nr:MAG: hypothetical protein EPO16_08640 [Dehalococcoidia bacterium]